MAADNFFSRWSRRKAGLDKQDAPAKPAEPSSPVQPGALRAADDKPAVAAQPAVPASDQAKPQLTMNDVAGLTPDSDYSPFLARGVDENVKRSAMKKLFSDPHFNVMDGLDTYIEDYNKFEPIPPEMLALLNHAKALLDPLSQLEKPLMSLADGTAGPAAANDRQEAGNAQAESAEAADDIAPPVVSGAPQASDVADVPAAPAEQAPERQDDAAPGNAVDPTKFSEARP